MATKEKKTKTTKSSPKSNVAKEQKKEVKVSAKAELTERQKFHAFFRDVYLADCYEALSGPHHPDKHGVLGYEGNSLQDWDIMTGEDLEPVRVDIIGICSKCSVSQESAAQAYKKYNG